MINDFLLISTRNMEYIELFLYVVMALCLVGFAWIVLNSFKEANRNFFKKFDQYKAECANNIHQIIENGRVNGFPVGKIIFIKNVDGIDIFYHFDSYQFLPDFLPNEDLMKEEIESTQEFLKSKVPPITFEGAIDLISEYYDYFPDSEAHLYKGDFIHKFPYLLTF